MRIAVLGLCILAGLFFSGSSWSSLDRAEAQQTLPPGAPRPTSQLIALSSDRGEGPQQIVLVDPERRTMSVYHVDRSSGAVQLKSVRNVQWDLLMEEYNAAAPLPREIRALVEQP